MTCLKFSLDEIKIPVGSGKTFDINQPTLLLTLNPLFRFVVFEIEAEIPFTIFNSPTIYADVSMAIDNIEAEVGVVLKGNTTSLLTPPDAKGLHFDSFGVGLGLMFAPPGFAIGLEGTFHIGDQGQVPLTDDSFAIVCEMEDEVPNPLYLAFNVPEMNLSDVITLFTNTSLNVDIPVSFSELSFRWAENIMEPVMLPDGSLAPVGYGFSGYMDLFGIQFYGYLQIDLSNGIQGTITMSPLTFGSLLKVTGDGNAVDIKVDKNGTPIPVNAIPKTVAEQQTINDATSQQIIAPGGPKMTISTSSSPYFTLDAKISLFELNNIQIDATIKEDGIYFELDYGGVMETTMSCILKDYHNFSGSFTYGIDLNIPLPVLSGFSLGSIDLNTGCDLNLLLTTSTSDITFQVQGSFELQGINLNFGPYNADINISSISELISSVGNYIIGNAQDIFSDFITDSTSWAGYVKNGVIQGVTDVASGLNIVFNQSPADVARIMNAVGYDANEIASGISGAFSCAPTAVAQAMVEGYNATDTVVAAAFEQCGIGAADTAQALKTAFGEGATDIHTIMLGAGYSDDVIKKAFESLGGDFASAAKDIWHGVKHWDHW
jgi:hypothetical protein